MPEKETLLATYFTHIRRKKSLL